MTAEQWMRSVVLEVGTQKFIYPDLSIDFAVDLDTDPDPNIGEIVVYNLSQATINAISPDPDGDPVPVVLTAGYRGDTGVILMGYVVEIDTQYHAPVQETRITVSDGSSEWVNRIVQAVFPEGVTASEILTRIIGDAGLELGELDLPADIVYDDGLTISGGVGAEASKIAEDCGAKLHILHSTVYIRPPPSGTNTAFVLRADTGLIGTPQRITGEEREADYNVQCLLNHRLVPDTIVKIESRTANGLYRVRKTTFTANEMDFTNAMEVVSL